MNGKANQSRGIGKNGNGVGCNVKWGGKEGSLKMGTLHKDPKEVRAFLSWSFPMFVHLVTLFTPIGNS